MPEGQRLRGAQRGRGLGEGGRLPEEPESLPGGSSEGLEREAATEEG